MAMSHRLIAGCLFSALIAAALPAANGGHRRCCRDACCQPQPCVAQCCQPQTCLVPEWTTETRTIPCIEYRTEQREQKCLVWKPVFEDQQQAYTVMVPYQETRKATRCVFDTVTDNVEQKYCVLVPYQETRKATRCVYDTVTDNVEQKYCVMVP